MPVVPMYSYLIWPLGAIAARARVSIGVRERLWLWQRARVRRARMGWQRWEAECVLGDVDAREQLATVVRVQVCDELACARRVQPRLA